jgi:uncharacterized RDD family membrane protein YckC
MAEATLSSGAASSESADEYGGFWIRTLAYSADISIIMLGLIAVAVPFAFLGGTGMSIYGVIAAVGPWAYFVWFAASEQQATYGKQLCGLKIEHAGTGERISLLRSLGRELAKILSGVVFMIGFLIAAFTRRKQGLHDFLATTVVVREGPARILLAVIVTIAGVVIPIIVIPLMFGAMFAALMMMVMGAMMGGAMMGGDEMKQLKPVPRIEQPAQRPQPAAPLPRASAPKPAVDAAATASIPQPEAKPAVAAPATARIPQPEPKRAAEAPAKPEALASAVARSTPAAPATKPKAAARRSESAAAVAPSAPAIRTGDAPLPCVYKPVMTDADIARCR